MSVSFIAELSPVYCCLCSYLDLHQSAEEKNISVIVLHWIKRLHEESTRPPKKAKFLFTELSFPQFGQYKPIEKTAWEITAVQFCYIFEYT